MRTTRWIGFVGLTTLAITTGLLGLAGCGKPSDDAGSQPTQGPSPISITRTGGFAGVNQVIEITPDGSWAYTDHRTNITEQGKLTAAQQAQILQAVSAPSFNAELLKTPVAIDCADTFRYTIMVGAQSVMFDECDQANKPAVMAAIAAISDATPF